MPVWVTIFAGLTAKDPRALIVIVTVTVWEGIEESLTVTEVVPGIVFAVTLSLLPEEPETSIMAVANVAFGAV